MQTLAEALAQERRRVEPAEPDPEALAEEKRPVEQIEPDPEVLATRQAHDARLLQIPEARLVQLAATEPCDCGGQGFVRFDLPPHHPAFGKGFACACQAGMSR